MSTAIGSGTPIGANDLWIVSHALNDYCTLVTNNLREFKRVAGLKLENWAQEPVPPLVVGCIADVQKLVCYKQRSY